MGTGKKPATILKKLKQRLNSVKDNPKLRRNLELKIQTIEKTGKK